MSQHPNRRKFITATSAGLVTSLAGCQTAAGKPPAPKTAAESTDGWQKRSQNITTLYETEIAGMTIKAQSHTVQYENAALRTRIKEDTFGRVNVPLFVFIAARIQFSPSIGDIPDVPGKDKLLSTVQKKAVSQMKSQFKQVGLTNLSTSDASPITVNTGEDATRTKITGTYPVDSFSFSVGDQSITIPGQDLDVEAWTCLWTHNGDIMVGSGMFPAENYKQSLTKELSGAVTTDIAINLGLTPDQYAATLRTLIKSTR